MLFLRRLWLALALIAAAFVFFFVRCFAPPEAAVAAAMLPVAVMIGSIPSLSYNTMGMLLLTIALMASGSSVLARRSASWIVVAVAAFALASFCYPTLCLASAFGCVALLVVHFRERAAVIALFGACAAAVVGVFLEIRTFGGVAAVLGAVRYNLAFGVQGGGVGKLSEIWKQIVDEVPYNEPLRIVIVLLAVAAAIMPRRRWMAIVPLVVALAAFLHSVTIWRAAMLVVFYAVILLAAPVVATADRKVLLCVWLPSIIAGATTAWTSSNGLPNAVVGLLPALVVTVAVLAAASPPSPSP